MYSVNVTMKNKLENLFCVKVNKWPDKKAEPISCIGNNVGRYWGCKKISNVVHHPAKAMKER